MLKVKAFMATGITGWIRRLYNWVMGWADSPYSQWALFGIAFAESSFFPIPPDILLIALGVALPLRALRYALICTLGSVTGGVFGYWIGHEFFGIIGEPIVQFYAAENQYLRIQELYRQYDAFAVAVAGLTPIPYKVATITAGFFEVNFGRFVLASALSRSLRFFLIGFLIRFFGAPIRSFIEKYFEILTIIFLILLVAGFAVLRLFF
jgi:membrane protein YqaA with SNARE-associated domain